ncbi:hypothetical protein AJ80_03043 [Polytolypa hystricis UAMH7299]|uniref:DUF7582 domain-containing protein n=1 Tax=Polytolypa hystricis (strain UAMH7299) TaxID=1447883 RepID=A0A2B7YK92_POLH7|nr:hypothetical protein AJ80_03043 [Polytolypa hystricis UAMH7299]
MEYPHLKSNHMDHSLQHGAYGFTNRYPTGHHTSPHQDAPFPTVTASAATNRGRNTPPLNTQGHSSPTPSIHRHDLKAAFDTAARHLEKQKTPAIIIAFDGAVDTLYFRTRETTTDLGFLSIASREQQQVLEAASALAEKDPKSPLERNWLNSEQDRIPQALHTELIQEAMAQQIVVYHHPCLQVLAGPWLYSFCVRVDRLVTRTHRSYDLSDAVDHLHQYIELHGQQPVRSNYITLLASRYGKQVTAQVLDEVEDLYRQRYRKPGIFLV